MKIDIDVHIMGVASRIDSIKELLADIGYDMSIVTLDDRGFNGGGDAWYNAKRIWLSGIPEGVTHRLILQDDIEVCNNFLTIVAKAIERFPEAIWSFYNKQALKIIRKYNTPYVRGVGCHTGALALCIPVQHILPIISWSDSILGTDYKHDDGRVAWYCAYHGVPLMRIDPSLVQHKQLKSTLSHDIHNKRYAKTFRKDVSDIDFDSPYVNMTAKTFCYLRLNKNHPKYKMAYAMTKAAMQRVADELRRDKNENCN